MFDLGVVTAVATGIPVVALVFAASLWLFTSNPVVKWVLVRDRRVSIGRELMAMGVPRHWVRAWISTCTSDLIHGRGPDHELELTRLDELSSQPQGSLVMDGLGHCSREESLRRLGASYQSYAARLRSRPNFGAGSAPIMTAVATVAESLASELEQHAEFTPVDGPFSAPLVVTTANAEIELRHLRSDGNPRSGIHSASVRHVRERWVVPGTIGEKIAIADDVQVHRLEVSHDVRETLTRRFGSPYSFEGVLPTLLHETVEVDAASGRRRLHLTVGEIAYSAVVAGKYLGSDSRGELPKLLTLGLLPVTADNYLLITQRSDTVGVAAGMWSPGVTGNLELRGRLGVAVDRDQFGRPDVLQAISRELREELGLEMRHESISVLGVAEFTSRSESGTDIVLTAAKLSAGTSDLPSFFHSGDALEGSWEMADVALGVPYPKTYDDKVRLLRWTMHDPTHVAHLSASLFALVWPTLVPSSASDAERLELMELIAKGGPADQPDGTLPIALR